MVYKSISIIIPCFNSKNKKTFINSIYNNILPQLNNLGFLIIQVLPVDENSKYVEKYKTTEYTDIVPKGIAIRDMVYRASKETEPDIIFCIDGSGRINPESIIDGIKLLGDLKLDAILGNREQEKCITDYRYNIERFEIFLVEDKYNTKIVDGQCGCWAYVNHKNIEKNLNFVAEGYEIELDLIIQILHKNLKYDFFPVKVQPKEKTSESLFKENDHKSKIIFLIKRLGFGKSKLMKLVGLYNETHKEKTLDIKYIEMLNRLDHSEI